MLTLLLGTDWTVNRDLILQRIAQDVADEKDRRILIVPELISHDMERRLCYAAGPTASRFAEVVTFSRLENRVSDYTGYGIPECLDKGGRVVAMASAARQLHSQLKAYASVETRPEFLTGLLDALDEFKKCCISPVDLHLASEKTQGSLAQKLEELSLLFEAYDSLCQQGKRDTADQMTWLLEQLEDCDFARSHVFYIDGFPDFTRQHMAVLAHFIQNSPHVVVSLNCDEPGSNKLAFEKAGETAALLLRIAQQMGTKVDIQYIPESNTPFNILRHCLFQGKLEKDPYLSEHLFTYRTETVYDECVAVAEEIMAQVRAGARYRDMSVVCTDAASYQNTLNRVFNRCKIPLYLSGTEDILDKSVISTVLTAVDAALSGFEQRLVIKYMKSILSPLDQRTCDEIENYAVIWNVHGEQWKNAWTKHPNGLGELWTQSAYETLAQLNTAREQLIDPLLRLQTAFRTAINLQQQVQAIYSFLEDIQYSDRLDQLARQMDAAGDNRTAQILNQLWEILLSALEQLHDVLGNTVWDSDTFTRLLKLLLSQYDVGTIPPVLDAVTAGPVSAMRCQQPKCLFIIGAKEGSFPGYSGSAGILTDQERVALRKLGVPLTGGAMEGVQAEFGEIYGVFCGAQERIYVSCPADQPSFLYQRLCSMGNERDSINSGLGAVLSDKIEAGAFLARLGAKEIAADIGVENEYLEALNHKEHCLGEMTKSTIRTLYGDILRLSASQIDRLADCRLSYFLKYGIKAKERKVAAVDPAEFGTYVHAVLEQTAREVKQLGGFRSITLPQILEIAGKHSATYASERFSEIDSQRFSYLFERNKHELDMVVEEMWRELRNSEFEPVEFEVAFGGTGEMQAISIEGKQMDAQLLGFVDRVDAWKNGDRTYFRVVDYKTGKKDFDYCDVFNGLGLQMLLYLFALENDGEQILGQNPIPAGVQYFPARAPLLPADGLLSEEDAIALREKLWKRKGLLLQDETVLSAMEVEEPSKRLSYVIKKDGSISGDLADRAQFQMLKSHIYSILRKMVDDVASGCVEPNPYTRGNSHNACAFCPYGSICHMESVAGRRNYKMMTAKRFWEEIEREEKNG